MKLHGAIDPMLHGETMTEQGLHVYVVVVLAAVAVSAAFNGKISGERIFSSNHTAAISTSKSFLSHINLCYACFSSDVVCVHVEIVFDRVECTPHAVKLLGTV
jgi:hypothetical protein